MGTVQNLRVQNYSSTRFATLGLQYAERQSQSYSRVNTLAIRFLLWGKGNMVKNLFRQVFCTSEWLTCLQLQAELGVFCWNLLKADYP